MECCTAGGTVWPLPSIQLVGAQQEKQCLGEASTFSSVKPGQSDGSVG